MIPTSMNRVRRTTTELVASERRLDAVREILRALETATAAGQQHLMTEGPRAAAPRGAGARPLGRRPAVEQDCGGARSARARGARLSPDSGAFARQAAAVADALDGDN